MSTPPSVPRAFWAALAAGVVAFATYISLVPFDFVRPPAGAGFWDLISSRLELEVASSSNLLANAIMFLPFGFFGLGALTTARSRLGWWVTAAALIVLTSMGVSFSIESLQMLLPHRTPSLVDVLAQLAGTIAGIGAWMVLGREVERWSSRFTTGQRSALEVGLVLYAAVQMLLLLEPLDVTVELSDLARKFRAGGIILNPVSSPSLRWDLFPSLLSAVVLAVPLGVLATILRTPAGQRRAVPVAVAAGGAFYLAGELAQVIIRSRTADVVDLGVNLLGVAAGAWATALVLPRSSVSAEVHARRHAWVVLALVASAALYAAYNWSPFDFQWSRQMVEERLSLLARVPFAGYYVNPEFKALDDVFIKVGLALPLGVFFELIARPARSPYGRLLVAGWLTVTAAFFATVELGQVFLPSRYPDNTDILLAAGAVWLGMRIARPFAGGQHRPT